MQNARIDGNVEIIEFIQVDDWDTVQVQSIYGRYSKGRRFDVADTIEKMSNHPHHKTRKVEM